MPPLIRQCFMPCTTGLNNLPLKWQKCVDSMGKIISLPILQIQISFSVNQTNEEGLQNDDIQYRSQTRILRNTYRCWLIRRQSKLMHNALRIKNLQNYFRGFLQHIGMMEVGNDFSLKKISIKSLHFQHGVNESLALFMILNGYGHLAKDKPRYYNE